MALRDHVLAPEGRGGGDGENELEVRVKTLEAQRDLDHAYLNELAKALQGLSHTLEADHVKAKEHEKALHEFAGISIQMRQGAAAARDTLAKRFDDIPLALKQIMEGTANAFGNLEAKLAEAFKSIQGDGKIIEETFLQARRDLEQVRAASFPPSTSSPTTSSPDSAIFT